MTIKTSEEISSSLRFFDLKLYKYSANTLKSGNSPSLSSEHEFVGSLGRAMNPPENALLGYTTQV